MAERMTSPFVRSWFFVSLTDAEGEFAGAVYVQAHGPRAAGHRVALDLDLLPEGGTGQGKIHEVTPEEIADVPKASRERLLSLDDMRALGLDPVPWEDE